MSNQKWVSIVWVEIFEYFKGYTSEDDRLNLVSLFIIVESEEGPWTTKGPRLMFCMYVCVFYCLLIQYIVTVYFLRTWAFIVLVQMWLYFFNFIHTFLCYCLHLFMYVLLLLLITFFYVHAITVFVYIFNSTLLCNKSSKRDGIHIRSEDWCYIVNFKCIIDIDRCKYFSLA